MIIKTEKKDGVTIYTVEKDYDDKVLAKKMDKFLKPDDIKKIIREDADVYTAEGKLLLRFRKSKLNKEHADAFYENIIKFAKNVSGLRGSASGSKKKTLGQANKVMSNIFGFFDRWTPSQKMIFTKLGRKPSINVRECRFNMDHPEEYKKTIPLIEDIDRWYAKLTPEHYGHQIRKAKQTPFKIANTSFTTITTNVNFQTGLHTDKGDDDEGFGNLAVIERGSYTGAETCFPQYGVGVDVRGGDVLFMDVHQPHANLPMHKKSQDTIRLSIVCYLRKNVWLNSKNKTRKFMEKHNKTVKSMRSVKGK
uniref:2OGFeDO JBP1/TET oxygenase domain-containing protein n=1 Tax=viral metagenome TaxID=1070528 RepID=A0A6C0JGH6_9ZZZZ